VREAQPREGDWRTAFRLEKASSIVHILMQILLQISPRPADPAEALPQATIFSNERDLPSYYSSYTCLQVLVTRDFGKVTGKVAMK
jgi:hypothetical protein